MRLLRKAAAVLAVAGIVLTGAAPVSAMTFFYGETPIDLRMDALQEIIEEVRENYKDETKLDDIFIGICQGLFSSLGDPWSAYVTVDKTDLDAKSQQIDELTAKVKEIESNKNDRSDLGYIG